MDASLVLMPLPPPVDLTTFDANDVNWQMLKFSRHSDFQWYPISMQIIKQQKINSYFSSFAFFLAPEGNHLMYRPANVYVCVSHLWSDAHNQHLFTFVLMTMMCDDATRVSQCNSILFIRFVWKYKRQRNKWRQMGQRERVRVKKSR